MDATFGQAKQASRDLVLSANSTVIELSGAGANFSYVSVKEEQSDGQLIWGWEIEGRYGARWRPLWKGASIGHRRILSCTELQGDTPTLKPFPSSQTVATSADTGADDPPPPPPKPTDVVFVECSRANAWVVHGDDGTIRTANATGVATGVATVVASYHSEAEEVCLTLDGDGAASRFQFVSATPCSSGGGASAVVSQQQWTYPWKAGQPALAFKHVSGTPMCIQINGDRPWVGNRAVVWDCQDGATDEAVALLPTTRSSTAHGEGGGHRMQIDMTSDGGSKLCMAVRAGLPPPPPPPSCAGVEALRFTVTEQATAVPTSLRELAVY